MEVTTLELFCGQTDLLLFVFVLQKGIDDIKKGPSKSMATEQVVVILADVGSIVVTTTET